MDKALRVFKKYYEVIGYSILTLFLFLACFFRAFSWVSLVYMIIFAFSLHKTEKILGLLFFYNSFKSLFNFNILGTSIVLKKFIGGVLIGIICIFYLIKLIKKQRKLNLKILIPIVLFLIYIALPIHECTIVAWISVMIFFAVLYIVYEERTDISFKYIVRLFSLGLVISCVFALFRSISPLLSRELQVVTIGPNIRFEGLYAHPNNLAVCCTLAICSLLILKLKRKISLPEFFGFFVVIFACGYSTLSRNFVISTAIGLVLSAIFYLVKNKKKSFAFIASLIVVIGIICGIFYQNTSIYINRMQGDFSTHFDKPSSSISKEEASSEQSSYNKSDEWYEAVLNGEITYDPGRKELRKEYIKDWSSSAKTILFGRGISRVHIGNLSSHNLVIQELWKVGIIGYLLYLAMILCSINYKKLKLIKRYLFVLMLLIPYIAISIVEDCNLDYISVSLILMLFGLAETKEKNNSKKKILYYNSTLCLGGTDTYMVNLIENMQGENFEFDVLIKSSENINKGLVDRLSAIGVNVYAMGNGTAKQILGSLKFLSKVNGQYDVMHINATSGAVGIYAYLGKDFGGIENVIFHSHMGGNDNKDTIIDSIGKVLIKNFSNKLVACSDVAGEFMFGKKYCAKHKVLVLNNSIDINKFKYNKKTREEYRKLLKLENNFVLFNIGRFAPQKNQVRLIEVFAEVAKKDKDSILVLVGVGPLEQDIINKAKELKVYSKIKMLGERDDVNKIMQMADVFVMTSIHEGLPIVAVETQASGLPLVLSDAITKATDITGNCTFVSLLENNKVWADEILKYKTFKRKDTSELIISHNFDNKSATEIIKSIY